MRHPSPNLAHDTRPWLLAAAFACVAPHYEHLPLWLSALNAGLLLWFALACSRQSNLPSRGLLACLVIAGSSGIWLEYRSLFGREAGVGLLVLLIAMKLHELHRRRDALVLVTLGYFLLLTHYFQSQSLLTGLWLLGCVILLTACLLRLHGSSGPPVGSLRLATRLGLQALPLMLLLYALFPRIAGPLWGLPADAHAGRTGLTDSMQPGNIANLAQNPEIAFQVRFLGATPARNRLYWRGPVMEAYDGQRWQVRPTRPAAEQIDYLSPPLPYETTLEPHGQRWLLALDAPRELPPETRLDGRLTVSQRQPLEQRQRFTLTASLDYRFNVDEAPGVLAANRQLPGTLNPRARALALRWQQTATHPQTIVDQALALFASTDFAYTLQPPLLGENAIDDFLFATRRGFCEHYAAAFVFLMRAAGIPARVVGGYLGGEINPVDGYLVVRQSDAHAWAEVWLAGRGWVRIDPTAVVAPARLDGGLLDALPGSEAPAALARLRTDWIRSLRYRWEALNNAWNQYVIAYDSQRQQQLLRRLGLPDSDWRMLAALLAGSSTLALLLLLGWTLRRKAPPDLTRRLWAQALRQVGPSTVDCAPWETPSMVAARVRQHQPELASAFAAVANAYLETRYGQGELRQLAQAVRALRQQRIRRMF